MIRVLTTICVILFNINCIIAQDVLIDWEDNWQYYDEGNEPDKQSGNKFWYEDDYVVDTILWKTGPAQLGYGDGDESTVTQETLTQYFRKEFTIPDASVYEDFDLDLLFDDGAVIYLNGVALGQINMPNGNINYNTFAVNTAENFIKEVQLVVTLVSI